jgi:SAM-dependent methyltransferase
MANDRQTAVNLGGIRADHLQRYLWAKQNAKGPILDAACGVGYGSFLFAEDGHEVTAVDVDPGAISFGQTYYGHGNIHWITSDLQGSPWGACKFKTIVSFETIEHLTSPQIALGLFHDCLDNDGKFYCSVPNEEKMPFKPENFAGDQYPHQRHYTPAQFEELLNSAGFDVIHRGTQLTKTSPVVTGSGGLFLVYTAVKKKYLNARVMDETTTVFGEALARLAAA